MAKKRIAQMEIPAELYGLGLSFYQDVTFELKGKSYFGFKCDSINEVMKEKIQSLFPQVEFFNSSPQYAPELKNGIVAFPRKTQLFITKA